MGLLTTMNAQTIEKIEFKNLSRISSDIALETLSLRQGDQIDIEKINQAIKDFYNFGYFDDIQVIDNNGILEFDFKEKPSIANVTINGYKSRQDDIQEVIKRIGLAKGTMYTQSKLDSAKNALLSELQREGYVNSVVEFDIQELNADSIAITIDVNKGDEIIIRTVNYHGAQNLDASDFELVTANKEKDFVSWWFGQNSGEAQIEQLPYENLRISELYFENGFLDAKVKPAFMKVDFSSNEAKLDFFIQEGPQYSVNDITIYLDASILDPETLYDDLKLRKEETFNIKDLRSDADYIKTQVANLGYAFAQVNYDIKKNTQNNSADVIFSVIPGQKVYINDVIISGNTKTLDRVIRRNVYLAHGDLFNLTDYDDSILKLKRTGFFEDIVIDQKRVSEDKMDLIVKVKEMPTGSLILGGGYGSYDGFIINASIQDRNIFGSGLNLGFSVDTSDKRDNYSISLSNPAIRDSEYNGKIKIYNSTFEIDDRSNQWGTYDWDKKTTGFLIGAGKELTRHTYAGLDYKIETNEEKFNYHTNYNPKGKRNDPLAGDYMLSSLTPYINYNSTDDYYFPRNGINTGTSLEFAGVGGDAKFLESATYLKYYFDLEDYIDWDAIFRYRGQVKAIVDNGYIPYGSSLSMGGPRSLRGYESYAFSQDLDDDPNKDPYKYLFTNGFELNFPLVASAKMRWGVFYDYGMIGEDSFSDTKRSGTGALIEWISPVGPLQFIFSQPIDDEPGDKTSTFEFSLGTSF
jgi:outer membrane protein insertion porin family